LQDRGKAAAHALALTRVDDQLLPPIKAFKAGDVMPRPRHFVEGDWIDGGSVHRCHRGCDYPARNAKLVPWGQLKLSSKLAAWAGGLALPDGAITALLPGSISTRWRHRRTPDYPQDHPGQQLTTGQAIATALQLVSWRASSIRHFASVFMISRVGDS
jgi:hypothetical protein